MKEQFVCNIDGFSFSTEEEMITHLLQNYSKKVEIKESLLDVADHFVELFPEYYVDRCLENEEGLHVGLSCKTYEADVHFTIGEKERHWDQAMHFKTMEDATFFVSRFIGNAERIRQALLSEYQIYDSTVEDIRIISIVQSDGTGDGTYEYRLQLVFKGIEPDSHSNVYYLEFEEDEVEREDYFLEKLSSIISGVKGNYIESIEGTVVEKSHYDRYSNERWYVVDGVSINTLAARAMKQKRKLLVKIL